MEDKYLIVGSENTTCKDCMKIIDRLCCENPNMTVQEFLNKHHQLKMILV